MPRSMRSNWSRQSSPAHSTGSTRFDPFLILDEAHKNHHPSDITELDDRQKIFCRKCLDLRSLDDIKDMDPKDYAKYIADLFELLGRYAETLELRKVVLPLLEKFLPVRPFTVRDDHQLHGILRMLYKIMKSELYEKNEFLSLVRVMSGLSIESLKPVPLRSVWEIWECLLKNAQQMVKFVGQDISDDITRYHIGQAEIVRSYLALCNSIDKNWISEIYFSPNRKIIFCEYFEESQMRCLRFTKELLVPNFELYLNRDSPQTAMGMIALSAMFGALSECFRNAVRKKNNDFLEWLRYKDILAIASRIFCRNLDTNYQKTIDNFIKTYVIHYIEKEYGSSMEIRDFITDDLKIETMANRIDQLLGENKRDACIFYILLNWVSIKLGSRYFVASRVKSMLTRMSAELLLVFEKIKSSVMLMRIFAFVAASAFVNQPSDSGIARFFEDSWQEMLRDKTLTRFRSIYCHELIVFERSYRNKFFIQLINCEAINYLIDRGIAQNSLVSTLTKFLEYPRLREIFCRFLKRNASNFFKKLIPMGTKGMNGKIMDDFASWLPAMFQETVLRYRNNTNLQQKREFCPRLVNLLSSINYLIVNAQKMKFNPEFDEQFIIDFTNIVEMIYTNITRTDQQHQGRSTTEIEFLIVANEFMALIIRTNDPCLMNLIQYVDFTLLGYMYHILDRYKSGDRLGEAIAQLLVAYSNLDYPLRHRVDDSLYPIFSNAYEWMMSKNQDLHTISVIMVQKLYSNVTPTQYDSSQVGYRNLSPNAKVCIVTGFMHMVCSNLELLENQATKAPIMSILKLEDFKYHPYYDVLAKSVPNLEISSQDECRLSPCSSSSSLSFASADTGSFEDVQMSVTRILEQLNEDEGYKSASVVNLPRNLYLNRILEDQAPEEVSDTMDWEKEVYDQPSLLDSRPKRSR